MPLTSKSSTQKTISHSVTISFSEAFSTTVTVTGEISGTILGTGAKLSAQSQNAWTITNAQSSTSTITYSLSQSSAITIPAGAYSIITTSYSSIPTHSSTFKTLAIVTGVLLNGGDTKNEQVSIDNTALLISLLTDSDSNCIITKPNLCSTEIEVMLRGNIQTTDGASGSYTITNTEKLCTDPTVHHDDL